jgi:hypothetical protein
MFMAATNLFKVVPYREKCLVKRDDNTLIANTLMVLLIPALAGGLWWITASSRFIGKKYKNQWWENLLMGFIFVLAIWGTIESAKSVIHMVKNMP